MREKRRWQPWITGILAALGSVASVAALGERVTIVDIALGGAIWALIGLGVGWIVDRARNVSKAHTASVPSGGTHGFHPGASAAQDAAGTDVRRSGGVTVGVQDVPTAGSAPLAVEQSTSDRMSPAAKPRRRWPWVVGACAVLLVIAAAADVLVRNREADKVLSRVESAEAVMEDWRERLERVLADAPPRDQVTATDLDEIQSALRQATSDATDDLRRARVRLVAADVLPWHGSISKARDSFLEHIDAWSDQWDSIRRGAGLSASISARIGSSFDQACDDLPAIVPAIDMRDLDKRIEDVCED
jgi:hypothetical protein